MEGLPSKIAWAQLLGLSLRRRLPISLWQTWQNASLKHVFLTMGFGADFGIMCLWYGYVERKS